MKNPPFWVPRFPPLNVPRVEEYVRLHPAQELKLHELGIRTKQQFEEALRIIP